ncbi:MAG TPA: PAS domain S-box protein [Candidatus Angelobacter sp.]|jgi:PAS domain S-box-containing protein|nr:PAS domain S-box protein [Candidatus Angelobacter sp.]
MPAAAERVLVLIVMTVMVGLFSWLYIRDRQHQTRLWLFGWVAIYVHFAAFAAVQFTTGTPHVFWIWVNRATLVVAGTFFLFSVSEVYQHSNRSRLLADMAVVSSFPLLYMSLISMGVREGWSYAGILLAAAVVYMSPALRHYGWKSWFWRLFVAVTLPYTVWAVVKALQGRPRYGTDFFLVGFFCTTGVLYYRHFRRLSPGILLTSLSFVAWGLVFPIGFYCVSHQVPVPSTVWDVPKYFVAFGMLLTLFENQAEAAQAIAGRYKELFEGNLAAVYVSTMDGTLLECNNAFLKMYGYLDIEEALSGHAQAVCADHKERKVFIEALEREGQVINYECRHARKDGTPIWVLERATIVSDGNGGRVIEGTAIDITERKQAELALRQSEERFATVFRQSPVGCAIVAADGVFLNANERLLQMIGRPAEEVIGKTSVELGFFKSARERQVFYQELRENGSLSNVNVRFRHASGAVREGLYFATLVGLGNRECILGMLLDQTEHRLLEAKLLQAQKMESLGRLAGGVAHDFNNLLGVIGGYAELLETKLEANEVYRRYCGKILETTERAGALTRQLLTFSRKQVTRPMPLRPDEMIRELATILPRMIGEDVEVRLELSSTGTVVMDKTQFEQIVLNIAVNARDAMPNGGQLTITTNDVTRSDSNGNGHGESMVCITMRDTGSGMDELTRSHAFEPFFTTKGIGQGTGLGLATVYGIVQQSNGEISLNSQPGQGTEVKILIPASLDLSQGTASPATNVAILRGTGTILLVEDEIDLREANAELLKSLGYKVICAGSGLEALEKAATTRSLDLVITDVVMPRMNGRQFADRLLEVSPETRLLFISGYADDVVLQTGVASGVPFLQKPYSVKQLATKVQELLALTKQN